MNALKAIQPLTAPVEDYLKAIFEIENTVATDPERASAAGTNEIAQALGIAPASVTGMLRRLAELGLISYERYRGVRLSDSGRRAALRTIRRHRVIEAYLTKALGYPWDRVHEEAERLEHAASDDLIDRMAAAIGEPATDPHGAPIPTREGIVDAPSLLALVEVPVGSIVRVRRVGDRDPERLRYLAQLGVTPGADVRVVARAPYGGPITLRIVRAGTQGRAERAAQGDRERSIGPILAAEVFVEARRSHTRPEGSRKREA
jgi:DtxR family transcriptional regulator, Mn-dependent transcriptional regulator